MLKLSAKMPFDDLLPLSVGTVTLSDDTPENMSIIDCPVGTEAKVSEVLKSAHGMGLPAANRTTGSAKNRCIWFGKNHLLLGPKPDDALTKVARLSDVSDGYAVLRAEGKDIEAVLARLVPLNLAQKHFKRGHTARSLIQHMHGSLTRVSDSAFHVIVFRSMAQTLVHDLERAMISVEARASLLK